MLGANTRMFFMMQDPTQQRVAKAVVFGAHWVISRPYSPKSLNERLRAILDPGYAMTIQPALPLSSQTRNQSKHVRSGEQNMVALTAQMQTFLPQPQESHDQFAPTWTAVRTNVGDNLDSQTQSEPDESILLI